MRAALYTGQSFTQVMPEALNEIQANQFFICKTKSVAISRIRHRIRHGLRINDIELGINGYSEPEIVNRLVGCALTRGEFNNAGFGIGDTCVDIPKTIITLESLRADFDAVFLGLGLAGVNTLGIPEPQAAGLADAVEFIAELRQASDLSAVPVGRHVLVIGGGMTAVDAAVQSKLLGAETVTIVYRRGAEAMPASAHEQAWAQTHGVLIRHWAAPEAVLAEGGQVTGVRFAATQLQGGKLVNTQLAVRIGIRRCYTGGAGCCDLGLGHLAVLVGVQGLKVEHWPDSGAAGHHALSAHAHLVLRLRRQGCKQPDAENGSQCRARQCLGPVHHTILFASGPVPRSMPLKRATPRFPSRASAEFCDIPPQADPAPLHLPDKRLDVALNDRRTPNEHPDHPAGR
jgi:hypothetical protein